MIHRFIIPACTCLVLFTQACNSGSTQKTLTETGSAEERTRSASGDAEEDDEITKTGQVNTAATGDADGMENTADTRDAQANALPTNQPENSPSPPGQLRIVEGQFFAYALPEGWRTTEDGQFAVVSVAPDNMAISIMVGNAGMPANYPAGQYIYNQLSRSGFQQVRMGPQGRPAKPIQGCSQAYAFDFSYSVNGVPCLGIATCHIAPAYDISTMIMTAAASVESQWNGYRGWLPEIPTLMQALSGEAFGARGIMQQNIRNSTAYAEAAKNYRAWSEKNWKDVTDDRNRSVDERNTQFRENLGAVQTYIDPYNPQRPLELSTQYKYYWIDPQGKTFGTNDPSVNPNQGSTIAWKRMQKKTGNQKN